MGDSGCILVHGIVGCLTQTGEANHAWIEDGDIPFELSQGRCLPFSKAAYYAHFQVVAVRRYALEEALLKLAASGHFGPWEVPHEKP
jgi:hypothetical protein